MAQKVVGYVRFQVPAGKATPAPPVGPALGQYGVNIGLFTKDFNERTKADMGLMIPVVITVYSDRSFTQDRRAEDARPELHRYRVCHQHDQGHLPLHGRCRRRISGHPTWEDLSIHYTTI